LHGHGIAGFDIGEQRVGGGVVAGGQCGARGVQFVGAEGVAFAGQAGLKVGDARKLYFQ